MKITNFSFTLRQAATKDSYGDNYYVNIDDNGAVNISHPYKSIEYKEQVALLAIIQSGIAKYALLVAECDAANQGLKLEECVPQQSTEVSSSESTDVSAVPQTCALGDGEVSTGAGVEIGDAPFEETKTGADGDIDKPKSTIVITKVTEEDDW